MKGFRLVEGINGLFVSMPSRKGTDEDGKDKWFDTIWIESREMRDNLNTLAITEYNNDGSAVSNAAPSAFKSSTTMSDEATTGDNIKGETSSAAANDSAAPAFSDEDIPF